VCGLVHHSFYDRKIRRVRDLSCGDVRIFLEVKIRRLYCRRCKKVKQERLQWLTDNPFYTKRFAFYVGGRCRDSSLRDVARELHLDWKTVKSLEKQYMREQLKRAGLPGSKVIGVDEISIRKGHTYRIVVSDLLNQRPIWFGGEDRSELSMDLFFEELGLKKSREIRLAVMDMWKAFVNSTQRHAPQAAIPYDKFHVMRHLNDALDRIRKSEYARLAGEEFAQMIESDWEGICAYINSEEKVSLGFLEGLNTKIRVIRRPAYGLRDREYLRLKVLTCMLPTL
jgi:transposase